MKILIQGAQIIDKRSPYHQEEKNVVISGGRILSISDKGTTADRVIKAEGMKLSIGWFDLGTFIGDPGLESSEDLASGTRAAAQGGFTEIAVLPNTQPVVQTKNEVAYLTQANGNRLVDVHSLAAVTRDCKGEELTEMIDLHTAGAVGFTDGNRPLWHTDILLKSLQYVQKFNGLILDRPEDIWLNRFGQMHEGPTSTLLGLKGMPRIAEEVVVSKNLELLGYAGGRLHFSRLSCAKSVELIRAAKKRLQATCDIAAYQALLDDSMVEGFDTNYKVNPPLRERTDQDALVKGLKDGTIDVICSGHAPHDVESKEVEFDHAAFGIINLQTFASNIVTLSQWVDYSTLIEKFTVAPRTLLGLEVPVLDIDARANLTLFDPDRVWTLDDKTNASRSRNSPWWGMQLVGKAVGVFNNSKHWIDQ
jgi:dihydroorotase